MYISTSKTGDKECVLNEREERFLLLILKKLEEYKWDIDKAALPFGDKDFINACVSLALYKNKYRLNPNYLNGVMKKINDINVYSIYYLLKTINKYYYKEINLVIKNILKLPLKKNYNISYPAHEKTIKTMGELIQYADFPQYVMRFLSKPIDIVCMFSNLFHWPNDIIRDISNNKRQYYRNSEINYLLSEYFKAKGIEYKILLSLRSDPIYIVETDYDRKHLHISSYSKSYPIYKYNGTWYVFDLEQEDNTDIAMCSSGISIGDEYITFPRIFDSGIKKLSEDDNNLIEKANNLYRRKTDMEGAYLVSNNPCSLLTTVEISKKDLIIYELAHNSPIYQDTIEKENYAHKIKEIEYEQSILISQMEDKIPEYKTTHIRTIG